MAAGSTSRVGYGRWRIRWRQDRHPGSVTAGGASGGGRIDIPGRLRPVARPAAAGSTSRVGYGRWHAVMRARWSSPSAVTVPACRPCQHLLPGPSRQPRRRPFRRRVGRRPGPAPARRVPDRPSSPRRARDRPGPGRAAC